MRALNSASITQRPTAVSPAPCHRMTRQDLTSKLNYSIRSLREDIIAYRARVQDAPQEMESNSTAAKQSKVRPSTQLLLNFPPFPEHTTFSFFLCLTTQCVQISYQNCSCTMVAWQKFAQVERLTKMFPNFLRKCQETGATRSCEGRWQGWERERESPYSGLVGRLNVWLLRESRNLFHRIISWSHFGKMLILLKLWEAQTG